MARGSIRKRGDNYYVIYRHAVETDEGVTYKQKWKRIGPKKRDAERYLEEVLPQITNGTYQDLPDVTLKEFATTFIEAHATRVRENTLRKYKTHLNHKILPFFAGRTLKSIKPLDVEKFLTSLINEGMSPNNAKKYLMTLKMIFKRACELGYLVKSPAEYIKPPRTTKTEMNYLSPTEIQSLISNVKEKYRALVMLACYTGLRQAEAFYLQWGDIDFANGYVHVRPNKLREVKSAAAVRKVPMIPELAEALQQHQLRQAVTVNENPHDLVFCGTKGNAWDPWNIEVRVFRPALALAGLRRVRWHDLRHSYATALLSSGEPLRYVSRLLGHADASVTLRVYSHILPETEVDAHRRHRAIFQQAYSGSAVY